MFKRCMNLDISKSWYLYDEHKDEPTAVERIIKRVKKRIRRHTRWLLVRVYAVPVLAGYLLIDALKRKFYAMEVKRGRAFGLSYRVYKGRGR